MHSDDPATADLLWDQIAEEMTGVRSNSHYDHLRVRALHGLGKYGEAEQILLAHIADKNVWHFVWLACALDGQGATAKLRTRSTLPRHSQQKKAAGCGW